MSVAGWVQAALLIAVLAAATAPLGRYMAHVFDGERVFLSPLLGPLERALFRRMRVDPDREQDWKAYARSLLVFSLLSWLVLYLLLRTQGSTPLNPEGFSSAPWDVSFNTASSFVSNTSWQFYGGETTLSYFVQMSGIVVASFTSGAVGIAAAIALIRGLARRDSGLLDNFWVDLVRATFYVLLPISIAAALVLVSQGVIQNFSGSLPIIGHGQIRQTLAMGPVASQEAIKLLSGDGGGFFNVNSAYPFENPTGLSNFVEMLLMLLVPAGLIYTFGQMVGRRREGWAIFAAMVALFVVGAVVIQAAEVHGSPAMQAAGAHGANLTGKEVRFGATGSALFDQTGTASGDGAVNSALESLTGLGSAVPMANIMSGEVIFGGPGSGLYGMLLIVLIAVFVAGLMVGRTPEYLGKKVGIREMKLAAVGTLVTPALVLLTTALAVATRLGRRSLFAHGPQGFSESLYAYLSQGNNNGSALAGYTGFIQPNAPGNVGSYGISFADLFGGLTMTVGRFVPILFVLALAGSLGSRRIVPQGLGTLRTDNTVFVVFLIGFIVLFALLNYLAALCLGPLTQALGGELY
ncbi:MAG: potassium-transporting ATPase subunit KdpA [Actinobacteria bacterium]|nr:potassium-transporting ATPase subunit KdpA [Actinomycetota bacterium]